MHHIRLKNKHYVAGLWWQVCNERQKINKVFLIAKNAVKNTQALEAYDAVVTLETQYGLGNFDSDIAKSYSLAASLKKSIGATVGIYRLSPEDAVKEIWWVFAVRENIILADGDTIVHSKAEALQIVATMEEVAGKFDSQTVYEAYDESLQALEAALVERKIWEQGPLFRLLYDEEAKKRQRGRILLGILVLGGLGYGADFMKTRYENYKVQQREARIAQARLEAQQARMRNLDNYFGTPWKEEPPAPHRLAQWMSFFNSVPSYSAGWEASELTFQEKGVTLHWAHQPHASFQVPPTKAQINGKNATSYFPLPKIDLVREGSRELLNKEEAITTFSQLVQDLGCTLSIKWNPPLTEKVGQMTVTAPYVIGQWSIGSIPSALLLDLSLGTVLNLEIPSIILNTLDFKDFTWTLKGTVYAKGR